MQATTADIEHILHLLAETPRHFTELGGAHDNEQLQHRSEPDAWSANDILAHLRACADVWGDTIAAMLTQDTPTLRHLSPRTYIRKTDYPKRNFHQSLTDFVQQRRQLLDTLQNLAFADWSRGAIIKERQHTVFTHARRMALHEMAHCEQLTAWVAQL